MSSPNTAARDAKFKERFLRRFSTKPQGRVSLNHDEIQSQVVAQAQGSPEDATRKLGAGNLHPDAKTVPAVTVEEAVDEPGMPELARLASQSPILASGREIQRQLGIDTPITADDIHEYRRQQSRTLSTRVPSNGSGPSFLSNSKQFVVEQCTFVDASHKLFESTESVGKGQPLSARLDPIDFFRLLQPFNSSARG